MTGLAKIGFARTNFVGTSLQRLVFIGIGVQILVLQRLICISYRYICMIACMLNEISLDHFNLWLLPLMGYVVVSFFTTKKYLLVPKMEFQVKKK
jgi:hypothetical protein